MNENPVRIVCKIILKLALLIIIRINILKLASSKKQPHDLLARTSLTITRTALLLQPIFVVISICMIKKAMD